MKDGKIKEVKIKRKRKKKKSLGPPLPQLEIQPIPFPISLVPVGLLLSPTTTPSTAIGQGGRGLSECLGDQACDCPTYWFETISFLKKKGRRGRKERCCVLIQTRRAAAPDWITFLGGGGCGAELDLSREGGKTGERKTHEK